MKLGPLIRAFINRKHSELFLSFGYKSSDFFALHVLPSSMTKETPPKNKQKNLVLELSSKSEDENVWDFKGYMYVCMYVS